MLRSSALLLLAASCLAGCPRRIDPVPAVETSALSQVRSILLVERTAEQETRAFKETRKDVEVDTRSGEREPRVVTTRTSDVLTVRGARARLFGDEEATAGFQVDNFLLIEFLGEREEVLRRVVVGYSEPVLVDGQPLDTAGQQAFRFGPGEIDLSAHLPRQPFRIRTTVLDTGGVGKVSDVWLRIEPGMASGNEDDWR